MSPDTQDEQELIKKLLPEIDIKEIVQIDTGWTNRIFIVNRGYVVRIPRNQDQKSPLRKEIRVTEAIHELLPVRIPKYISYNLDSGQPAAAYEYIDGAILSQQGFEDLQSETSPAGLGQEELKLLNDQLAGILASLHGINPSLLKNALESSEEQNWDNYMGDALGRGERISKRYFSGSLLASCLKKLGEIRQDPSLLDHERRLIHGDFGGWNLIYDHRGRKVAGIVDWEDCRLDDPASDFGDLLSDFGSGFVEDLLQKCNPGKEESMLHRAGAYAFINAIRDYSFGFENHRKQIREKALGCIIWYLDQHP